ncbi:MAG: glycosyltransferase family 2 protein [Candidatus Poseidoniia archaeon]|nr:glycosyltransferase family 2 protein [Candidatus Poseidoniia archaeon]
MKLSFIIPCYNEVKTIQRAIEEVRGLQIEKEIIIIDNCSTDGTREVLKDMESSDLRIVYQDRNYGFGRSIQVGSSLANAEFIYIQFSDLEYELNKCYEMLRIAIRDNLDAVFGSRLRSIRKKESFYSIIKEKPAFIATFITTFLINKWYGYNLTDIIGSKLYRTTSLKKVIPKTNGQGFDFELVSIMCKRKFRIKEIEVGYTPRENPGDKKIKPYHMINALWAMLKVRFLY